MEEAISIALERNLFALSLFQREDEHNCFHVLGATKRLLVFSYITFSQSHAGDSAVLRQFNYIITNTLTKRGGPGEGKVHQCTGTEELYRPYGP